MTEEEMRLRLAAWVKCMGDFMTVMIMAGTSHLFYDCWEEYFREKSRERWGDD